MLFMLNFERTLEVVKGLSRVVFCTFDCKNQENHKPLFYIGTMKFVHLFQNLPTKRCRVEINLRKKTY